MVRPDIALYQQGEKLIHPRQLWSLGLRATGGCGIAEIHSGLPVPLSSLWSNASDMSLLDRAVFSVACGLQMSGWLEYL